MSDIRTFCPQCECETVHSVLDEPVVLTVGMLDCRGQRGHVRVGTEMLRCGVCQRTQPNPGYLMPMLSEAHTAMLQKSFHRATVQITTEWMDEIKRMRRGAACLTLMQAIGVLGISIAAHSDGYGQAIRLGLGLSTGLMVAGVVLWWRSRGIESFEFVAKRVTRRWMTRMAEAE